MEQECQVPPEGWLCTRGEGHDGPCAAVEDKSPSEDFVAGFNDGYSEGYQNGRIDEDELKTLRAIKQEVDDVLLVDWISVRDNDYRKALNDLVCWNIQIHEDPAVSEIAAKRALIVKLVEAADYLQHCRRSQASGHKYGDDLTANENRIKRASEAYDYLRGQVKL